MSYEESLKSSDKRVRSDILDAIYKDNKLSIDEKISFFTKSLSDSHDLVRSKAVELLSEYNNQAIIGILVNHLLNESFWGVRYLILKKIKQNIEFWDPGNYINELSAFINDPKPQVRIICAQLLAHGRIGAWEKIGEIFYDKDPDVRREVQSILEKSPDPDIQQKIQEHLRLMKEKAEKKKDIQAMFDGI